MKNIYLIFFVNTILNLLVNFNILSNKTTFLNIVLTAVLIVIISTKYIASNITADIENTIDSEMAYIYPIILSVCLLMVYFIIKYFGKYKDIILKLLFFTSIVSSLLNILPYDKAMIFGVTLVWFIIDYLTENKYENYKMYINNLIAIMVAISSIKSMEINNVKTGMILLAGLFLFDVFWVFGSKYIINNFFKKEALKETNVNPSKTSDKVLPEEESVMEKIAKNVNSPILLKYYFSKNKPMILGLGDIILPAVFIKTLVNNTPYYNTAIVSYIFGLVSAIAATLISGVGQPALLYIVPSLIIPVLLRNKYTDNKVL